LAQSTRLAGTCRRKHQTDRFAWIYCEGAVTSQLPPKPDFEALEAAAPGSADRRTVILALIGNLVFSWSNNESLLIYILMLLLKTDDISATVVFGTLNTTRARLDLIQRLAKINITDRVINSALAKIIDRFNECTRVRNEFNHCMYTIDTHGVITHTQSIRITEMRGGIQLGSVTPMDEKRINQMVATIRDLTRLNREIWGFLPQLEAHLAKGRGKSSKQPPSPAPSK
jgi:hypothetical protein